MSGSTTANSNNGRILHLARDAALALGAIASAGLFYAEQYQASLVLAVVSWLFGAALHHAWLLFTPDSGDAWVLLRWRRFRWLLALASVSLALNIVFAYSDYNLASQSALIIAVLLAFELIPVFLLVGAAMWLWGMTAAIIVGAIIGVSVTAAWLLHSVRGGALD